MYRPQGPYAIRHTSSALFHLHRRNNSHIVGYILFIRFYVSVRTVVKVMYSRHMSQQLCPRCGSRLGSPQEGRHEAFKCSTKQNQGARSASLFRAHLHHLACASCLQRQSLVAPQCLLVMAQMTSRQLTDQAHGRAAIVEVVTVTGMIQLGDRERTK